MDPAKEYELANSVLSLVGEDPIAFPIEGPAREKVEHLLSVYAARLRRKEPRYELLKDDTMLPDLVVQRLVAILKEN